MQDYSYQRRYYRAQPVIKKKPVKIKIFIIVILSIVIFKALSLSLNKHVIPVDTSVDNGVGEIKPTVIATINKTPQATKTINVSKSQIINEVENLYRDRRGSYGWYVITLGDNQGYGSNFDFSFTAASVNKLPIMIAFLQEVENGNINLDDNYKLASKDMEGGSGTLQYQKLGSSWTYRQLVELSGHYSDNTAINAMHRIIGFGSAQRLTDDQNMTNTNIIKNTSSPKDMAIFLSKIYFSQILKDHDLINLFYTVLQKTEYEEDLIPEGVPDDILVSHKIGWQIQVWNDCGIVFAAKPYVLCVMNDQIVEAEARELLPQISRKIYSYEGN